MRYIMFDHNEYFHFALLVRPGALNERELERYYVTALQERGVPRDEVIAFAVDTEQGKVTATLAKAWLARMLPHLKELRVKTLYVIDSAYFKVLTKLGKAEPHYGYVLPAKLEGFEDFNVVLGLSYQQLLYQPSLQSRMDMTLAAAAGQYTQTYVAPGDDIIREAHYPSDTFEIAQALADLHQYPVISCDIEAFSLKFHEAGIGTVAFAWEIGRGVAFACDYLSVPQGQDDAGKPDGLFGVNRPNVPVRLLLMDFFSHYPGRIVWHGSSYDLKAIIRTLWMTDLADYRGLKRGLDILTGPTGDQFEDTRLIAYLATNSTAGNQTGLKYLAHEYAGNWAVEEIGDIRRIPLDKLLRYNLVDALSTLWVKQQYEPKMVEDQQVMLYRRLFLPNQRLNIFKEMVGMPMSRSAIARLRAELEVKVGEIKARLARTQAVAELERRQTAMAWERDYQKRLEKAKQPERILRKDRVTFPIQPYNPNSGPQNQCLLYEVMGLPVVDLTDTKQPATGGDTLKKLLHLTQDPEHQQILHDLIDYLDADKILTAFVPAFEQAIPKGVPGQDPDVVWLYGNFKIGGTVSGRESSNDPNLQNLPANSVYGPAVKACFVSPPGYVFAGADFASLEDKVNALLTRDANKLKVYTDGYDGHSLRAFSYFGDQMPDIDPNSVESINSIEHRYKRLRQDSKAPTFALTFFGTYRTLMKNLGWSEDKAKRVEANYRSLYAESITWAQDQLKQAARRGYGLGAFGLRIRCPLMAQCVWGGPRVPAEAEAEGRTLGNAISGQSYGLLTSRASVAFWEKVWTSDLAIDDILPIGQIHDAIYLLIRDDCDVVAWANQHLIQEMAWQALPELAHDQVKLSAQLDLYYPHWANNYLTLPVDAPASDLPTIVSAGLAKFKQAEQAKQAKDQKAA